VCVLVQRIYGAYKVVENSETIFRRKSLDQLPFKHSKIKKERVKEKREKRVVILNDDYLTNLGKWNENDGEKEKRRRKGRVLEGWE